MIYLKQFYPDVQVSHIIAPPWLVFPPAFPAPGAKHALALKRTELLAKICQHELLGMTPGLS